MATKTKNEELLRDLIAQRAARLGVSVEAVRAELDAPPPAGESEQQARDSGRTPEQLREWDQLVLQQAPYPRPECLTAPEIANMVRDEAALPPARRTHYETCSYCRAQTAMARPDRAYAAEVGARMAAVMRERPDEPKPVSAPTWVRPVGGFLAGVALMLVIWIDTAPSRFGVGSDPGSDNASRGRQVARREVPPAGVFISRIGEGIESAWDKNQAKDLPTAIDAFANHLTNVANSDMSSLDEADQNEVRTKLKTAAKTFRIKLDEFHADEKSADKIKDQVNEQVLELKATIARPASLPGQGDV